MAEITHVEIRCYRYACPDCGMTDAELGHLATDSEIHCMVCLVDEDRHVVLRRWLVEDTVSSTSADDKKTELR